MAQTDRRLLELLNKLLGMNRCTAALLLLVIAVYSLNTEGECVCVMFFICIYFLILRLSIDFARISSVKMSINTEFGVLAILECMVLISNKFSLLF